MVTKPNSPFPHWVIIPGSPLLVVCLITTLLLFHVPFISQLNFLILFFWSCPRANVIVRAPFAVAKPMGMCGKVLSTHRNAWSCLLSSHCSVLLDQLPPSSVADLRTSPTVALNLGAFCFESMCLPSSPRALHLILLSPHPKTGLSQLFPQGILINATAAKMHGMLFSYLVVRVLLLVVS